MSLEAYDFQYPINELSLDEYQWQDISLQFLTNRLRPPYLLFQRNRAAYIPMSLTLTICIRIVIILQLNYLFRSSQQDSDKNHLVVMEHQELCREFSIFF
jgi:hypothetical protein